LPSRRRMPSCPTGGGSMYFEPPFQRHRLRNRDDAIVNTVRTVRRAKPRVAAYVVRLTLNVGGSASCWYDRDDLTHGVGGACCAGYNAGIVGGGGVSAVIRGSNCRSRGSANGQTNRGACDSGCSCGPSSAVITAGRVGVHNSGRMIGVTARGIDARRRMVVGRIAGRRVIGRCSAGGRSHRAVSGLAGCSIAVLIRMGGITAVSALIVR